MERWELNEIIDPVGIIGIDDPVEKIPVEEEIPRPHVSNRGRSDRRDSTSGPAQS